jgi:hypothetical protein
VAGGQEGGKEVAKQLPRDDVVLVVCLAGARRQWINGTTTRPSAAEVRAHRRCGPVVLVQENEIGRACELQWVAVVLLEHWIGDGERQRRLSTTSRSCGGGPVRWRAREEEKKCKCGCENARGRTLEVQGRTSSREESTASESWCWRPTACVAAAGGARAMAGAAWRMEKKTARRTRVAAGRGATRGDCQEQEVAPVGLQRRRAAAESSSGGWQSGVARRGEGQHGVGFGGADAEAARGARKGGAGAAGAQHMDGEGGGAAQRRNRGGEGWR